ncbi:MAG: hypothetical protein CVV64_14280 [Candidatus Wallbacteria bacterium HGW-Wallbacteria-1]|jgi:hypothetical protein|uniref:Uncharacterized protein n=1 Tax=Candidatus Wallbacteria bacterium HGW-Wallbacteria-1 TaxID=2013854 RepID=A0A2N1PM77_9BACT|nr:MAG: hypothetical protein CVV64_14280 [Candidatus Wallbacteria bacterium HGW-Wallbacteria-1]
MDREQFDRILIRATELDSQTREISEETDHKGVRITENDSELGLQDLASVCDEMGIENRHLARAVAEIREESGSIWINGDTDSVSRFMIAELVRGLKGSYTLNDPLFANENSESPEVITDLQNRSSRKSATFTWKDGPGARFTIIFDKAPEGGTSIAIDSDFTRIERGIRLTGRVAGVFLGSVGLFTGLSLGGTELYTLAGLFGALGFLMSWAFGKAGTDQMLKAHGRVFDMVRGFKTIYEMSAEKAKPVDSSEMLSR